MQQTNNNKNIIDIIQDKVNEICEEIWKDDDCRPIFKVSILFEGEHLKNHRIILTITHLKRSYSRIIFNDEDSFYGYGNIEDEMKDLYNQTM